MRRRLQDNSLLIVLTLLFLGIWLGGQATSGLRAYNEEQREHGGATVSFGTYLTTAHFGEATFENWESEFLQMGSYVLLTVWLRQRGSAESRPLDDDEGEAEGDHRDDPMAPWPVRRGGAIALVYRNSLSAAFILLFAASWSLHAWTGAHAYSEEQQAHGGQAVTMWQYIGRAQFWFESLQNWQSEFLAVIAIVLLSIFLRQEGSPESKPVSAPHAQTGS